MSSTEIPDDIDERLSTKQAAEILGVTSGRVIQLAQSGKLPYVEISVPGLAWPVRLYHRRDVEARAAERRRAA